MSKMIGWMVFYTISPIFWCEQIISINLMSYKHSKYTINKQLQFALKPPSFVRGLENENQYKYYICLTEFYRITPTNEKLGQPIHTYVIMSLTPFNEYRKHWIVFIFYLFISNEYKQTKNRLNWQCPRTKLGGLSANCNCLLIVYLLCL
jgi:hypothetical protein